MAKFGAQSFYFTVEARLFRNGWPAEHRLVLLALCSLAAEQNQAGVFRLNSEDLRDAAAALGVKRAGLVQKSLEFLQESCTIKLYSDRTVWIKSFWEYRGTVDNPLHRRGVDRVLALYPSAREDFENHYGKLIPNDIPNNIPRAPASPIPSPSPRASNTTAATAAGNNQPSAEVPIPDLGEIPADATTSERKALAEMNKWPRFKASYQHRLTALRELAIEYPLLDLLTVVVDLTNWDRDNPGKVKNWLSRLNNFAKFAEERRRRNQGYQNSAANGTPRQSYIDHDELARQTDRQLYAGIFDTRKPPQ